MDEEDHSASEDSLCITDTARKSSPSKAARGASRRGRGRAKRTQKASSDNDSAQNGNPQVASQKHVGKFRYLSNLTQPESNVEVESAKVVANRGKRGNGRGRGRGRGSISHVTPTVKQTEESPSHVSSRGRRIKPNNRWDFETISTPTRSTTRRSANKNAKVVSQEASPPKDPAPPPEQNEKDSDTHEKDSDPLEKDSTPEEEVIQETVIQEAVVYSPITTAIETETVETEIVHEESHVVTEIIEHEIEIEVVEETNEVVKESVTDIEAESEVVLTSDSKEICDTVQSDQTVDSPAVDEQTCMEVDVPSSPVDQTVETDANTDSLNKECLPEETVQDHVVEEPAVVEPQPSASSLKTDEPECKEGSSKNVLQSESNESSESGISEKEDSSQSSVVKDFAVDQLSNSSASNTPRGDDERFDAQSCLISPKPVKVKSRWRRTSELEQVVGRNGYVDQSSCNSSPIPMSPKTVSNPSLSLSGNDHSEDKSQSDSSRDHTAIIEERLKSFDLVEENVYLTSRKTSKEVKRMLCDCTLSKEEIARGELGCGEDCINRLLMIECGSRCQLGDRCTNKRFQKHQYAKTEVFNTEKKGMGLRALVDLEPGDFIIEYVGEVIDPREFYRRAKEYAREKNKHYYFMALKSDAIIDATQQGNISRFINHSCDPNAETQKWTVNGDLRIGFFVRKSLKAGEEVTFDYQFQRYGKEAQRCYCESNNCRGWIGEDPEKEEKGREERKKRDREQKKKKYLLRDEVNTVDLETEIERLAATGIKNRAQTLNLSRLMVRAEDFEARRSILSILKNSEQPCRRLFLDYHGLKLLWGWMVDVSSVSNNPETTQFKLELLSALSSLPVPNKTMLLDSKVLSIVEKWATSNEAQFTEAVKSEDPVENEQSPDTQSELSNQVIVAATQLLDSWSNLKEVFRIPKKERIEKMKEHEREADREHGETLQETEEQTIKISSYDRRPNNRNDHFRDGKDKMKRSRGESPDRENRKVPRIEVDDNLSKEERRRLFALKVAQQDEELRARKCQEEVWRRQLEQLLPFGLEQKIPALNFEATPFLPSASPGFNNTPMPQLYWDPLLGTWQPCPEEGGTLQGNASALTPLSESSSTAAVKVPTEPPVLHLVIPKGYNPTVMGPLVVDFDVCEFENPNPPFVSAFLVVPASEEAPESSKPKDPETASQPTLKLPRRWRQAVDERGRTYYYHVRLRVPQWEAPSPDGETPEFSSEEEEDDDEEEGEEEAVIDVPAADANDSVTDPSLFSDNPKERERAKRRSLLCHEKIISPRSDFERSEDAQRYRELKERLLRQKLARIRERGLLIEEPKVEKTKIREKEKERRKLSEKEREKLKKRAKEKHKRSLSKAENRKKPKEHVSKGTTDAIPAGEKKEEVVVNGETSDPASVVKDLMDGSMEDDALANNVDLEDEIGEHERNKDVSANTVRKIKDAFRMKISSDIVNILNPYRRPDCKFGRITCNDDFKHLARKMTHFVLAKELKHCRKIEDLVVNDSVKHKAKDFIKKYMMKFGPAYKRSNDDE